MTRSRFFSVLAALVATAFACAGLALIGAPANASAEHGAKKLPPKPKVGQCRTTTFAQSFSDSDSRAAVPCSQPHRMKTYAVVTEPKSADFKHITSNRLEALAVKACSPGFPKALGSTSAARDQTAYFWQYFGPTKAQRKAGARWIRCDIVLIATIPGQNSQYVALPNLAFPMIGTRAITDVTRRCLSDTTHHYWTTCSRPHVARADQTFTIDSPALPSQKTIDTRSATSCPGKRTTSPTPYEWRLGDHTITCYSVTTS